MNNILGYYLMPHPPIIIPDIGRGEERKIENTSNACNEVGFEVGNLKPETIVLITPHATMFSDAIAISDEERIAGDLFQFRCKNISMDLKIDREFVNKLDMNCHLEGIETIPVNKEFLLKYNKKFELDHGTIVPLYFINKYYIDYSIVHITYAPLGDMTLYRFGMEIKKVAEELNRKIVIIASGDLSHKLKEEGPYSYSPYGKKFDNEFLSNLEKGDLVSLFTMDTITIEGAAQCGMNSVNILLGALNGSEFKGNLLSYEGPFGVGYGVMKFEDSNNRFDGLSALVKAKEEKLIVNMKNSNPYTRLARESLNYYYSQGVRMSLPKDIPDDLLNEKHGVFVSLKKFGELRGCIGTIAPTTNSVAEEIIRNAIESAIEDPRFPAVTEEELRDITISVDVLMDPLVCSKGDLDPKRYGVIVSKGYRRGLLLPDLEGVDTIERQLEIACSKAGIDFMEEYTIERFEVIRYKEGE